MFADFAADGVTSFGLQHPNSGPQSVENLSVDLGRGARDEIFLVSHARRSCGVFLVCDSHVLVVTRAVLCLSCANQPGMLSQRTSPIVSVPGANFYACRCTVTEAASVLRRGPCLRLTSHEIGVTRPAST